MKRLMIHYFSGTGNTRHAVRLIGEKFKDEGYIVEYANIEDLKNPPFRAGHC
jgi:flavodoxin